MNYEWLNEFQDPYLKKETGKGVFLCGVVLGFIASCQSGKGGDINNAPLFKKLMFGRLQKRDLKKHMADIPTLLKAYDVPYPREIIEIARTSGELMLTGSEDLGVDGNFLFSTSFLNAWKYFYRICDHIKPKQPSTEEKHELQEPA